MEFPQNFVGLPFESGGRSLKGCDCWGLVRLVYASCLGVILPSYGDISADDLASIAKRMSADAVDLLPWRAVEKPEVFDVCVMRWYGRREAAHVGVMVDSKRVLHTERVLGSSCIVPIDHYSIKSRIAFFRRHKGEQYAV